MIAPERRRRLADQVMWPLLPIPGESLLGFAARTAHHNVLPSGYTILRRAGHTDLQRTYTSLEGDVDVATIARALGVDEAGVIARRLPSAGDPGFVLLHGEPVRREDMVTHLRRFGPSRLTRAINGRLRNSALPAVTAVMRSAVADLPGEDDPTVAGYFDAAVAALGRSSRMIAPARAKGVFINRLVYTGLRFRLGFDRRELDELGEVHADRLGVELAAIDLLLPMYAIPQLAARDLLAVHSHGWWLDQFGMDQTTKTAVAAFRARLRKAASRAGTIEDPIQLSWAMRAFGGGPKPWGATLRALIEGGVPFELTGPEKTNYIVISRADIGRCCQPVQGTGLAEYSQRDALDVLNLNLRFAPRLADLARTGLGRTAWRIPANALMRATTECVTAGELSARTGLHSNVIAKKLRALDVPEALIGWERERAEAALAKLLSGSIGGRLLAA